MQSWPSLRMILVALGAILTLALLAAWRADRRDRAQLTAQLDSANQALTQTSLRQRTREAQLQQALAAIALQKRTVVTPAQIVRELPKQIPLPAPITLQTQDPRTGSPSSDPREPGLSPKGKTESTPGWFGAFGRTQSCVARQQRSPSPGGTTETNAESTNQAQLPLADLKPIYDFALDCRVCQAKLAAAQGDLTDERAKTALVTRERAAAVRAAKGGSALRRTARATKWFLLGAAAGIVASRAAH